jgi:hypothetical protein
VKSGGNTPDADPAGDDAPSPFSSPEEAFLPSEGFMGRLALYFRKEKFDPRAGDGIPPPAGSVNPGGEASG